MNDVLAWGAEHLTALWALLQESGSLLVSGGLLENPRPETVLFLALIFDLLTRSAALSGLVPGPVGGLEALAGSLENKLNRPGRGQRTLAIRGIIVMLFLVPVAGLGGFVLSGLLAPLPQGWVVEVLIMAALIQLRLPFGQVLRLNRAMKDGHQVKMRQRARPFYGATAPDGDIFALRRTAIEHLAQSIGTGLIGIMFWYLVAGLGGALAFKMVLILNHSWNDDAPQRRAFAMGAAWLADLMALPGCILSLLILTLASLATPGGRPAYAFAVGLRGSSKFRNRAAGLSVGAMAGALGVSLAGPRNFGPLVKGSLRLQTPWVGANSGRARVSGEDVRRALFLYLVAAVMTLSLLGLWLNLAGSSTL